jgi:hypothetical protein
MFFEDTITSSSFPSTISIIAADDDDDNGSRSSVEKVVAMILCEFVCDSFLFWFWICTGLPVLYVLPITGTWLGRTYYILM